MKRIGVFGSTGSIGVQALSVIGAHPEELKAEILTCNSSAELLSRQISRFRPSLAVTGSEKDARALAAVHRGTEFLWGPRGLAEAAAASYDLMLNGLVGMAGMRPTYAAIEAGRTVALANKETLVAAGALIMEAAARRQVPILPVDSEHSAVFQCLQGNLDNPPRRILLTASGGPFLGWSPEQLKTVTREQALRHPNWSMGPKITVDSATLMNKGLEVIEARWLFDVPAEKIRVLIHPESIVHSMVEFEDTSVLAQLGRPDMRVPISYALFYPERKRTEGMSSLDFLGEGRKLTFQEPDTEAFPCLGYAFHVLKEGGTAAAALNGANEAAVEAFLGGRISFSGIPRLLDTVLRTCGTRALDSLEAAEAADREAREQAERLIRGGTL